MSKTDITKYITHCITEQEHKKNRYDVVKILNRIKAMINGSVDMDDEKPKARYIKINDNLYKCSHCDTKHPVDNPYIDLYPFCKQCGHEMTLTGAKETDNCSKCEYWRFTAERQGIRYGKCCGKYAGYTMPFDDWCNKFKRR